MHFTTPTLLALTGLATATINFGTSTVPGGDNNAPAYQVAWIDGADACKWTYVSNNNENPCDKGKFKLSNNYEYKLSNCGDARFSLLNGDGSYNHLSKYKPGKDKYCTNDHGGYYVKQVWQF